MTDGKCGSVLGYESGKFKEERSIGSRQSTCSRIINVNAAGFQPENLMKT